MTDELKKALEAAKTEEEAKAVAEKFKDEIKKLTPEELEGVTGGAIYGSRGGNSKGFFFEDTVVAFSTPGPDKYSD